MMDECSLLPAASTRYFPRRCHQRATTSSSTGDFGPDAERRAAPTTLTTRLVFSAPVRRSWSHAPARPLPRCPRRRSRRRRCHRRRHCGGPECKECRAIVRTPAGSADGTTPWLWVQQQPGVFRCCAIQRLRHQHERLTPPSARPGAHLASPGIAQSAPDTRLRPRECPCGVHLRRQLA